ncbi:hypothetical protein DPM19_15675 [Actinomadura craniellae]|uniref:MinD-like ATPase involved in chromosome partitioning or flagellar assembly n=1 Tax=Actinomadura craniellae TaxID=2231787 RepID=A0A365H5M9_9ACTN|nr:TcpE family conjugal transfer membrane protein [Actinomadura craniellae]RAY14397.1 hypothetical protein DPM19_15675 [Actinomadura craniellae]
MDLPTYTNIWRIEKRLYKLYDLRLPMPLPLVQIGVFVGIFVPWILMLQLVGVPFRTPWHVLYLVPPGVLTWLATRPVIEGKRLTELLLSQTRYLAEPRTWCRLTPIREPREVLVTARIWRRADGTATAPAAMERAALRAHRARGIGVEPAVAVRAVPAPRAETEPVAAAARPGVPAGHREQAMESGPAGCRAARTWRPTTPREISHEPEGTPTPPGDRRVAGAVPPTEPPRRTEEDRPAPVERERPPATPVLEVPPARRADEPVAGKRGLASGVRRPGAPGGFWPAIAPQAEGSASDAAAQRPPAPEPPDTRPDLPGHEVPAQTATVGDPGAAESPAGRGDHRHVAETPSTEPPAAQDDPRRTAETPIAEPPAGQSDRRRVAEAPSAEPPAGQSDPWRTVETPIAEPPAAETPAAGGAPVEAAGTREQAPAPAREEPVAEGPPPAAAPGGDEPPRARPPVAPAPITRPDIPQTPPTTVPDIPMVPGAFGARRPVQDRPGEPVPSAAGPSVPPAPEERAAAEATRAEQTTAGPADGPARPEEAEQVAHVTEEPAAAAGETASDRPEVAARAEGPGAPDREQSPAPSETGERTGEAEVPRAPRPWSEGLSRPLRAARTDAMLWPPLPPPGRAAPAPGEPGRAVDRNVPAGPPPGEPVRETDAPGRASAPETPAAQNETSAPAQPPVPYRPARPSGDPFMPSRPGGGAPGTGSPWPGAPARPEPDGDERYGTDSPWPAERPADEEQPPAREVRSGPASPVRPRPLPGPPSPPPAPAAITQPDPEQETAGGGGLRRLIRAVGGGYSEVDQDYQERLQRPFQGTRRIVVLGCTGGAGQSVTALMLGHTFAQHCGEPIVAIDVNPGPGALARRTRSETHETLTGLITRADQIGSLTAMRRYTSQAKSGLDVIAAGKNPLQALDDRDYALAIRTLDRFYSITLLDAAAAVVARVLPHADQIVLVAPASADAPRAVSMTFEWLDGHGYDELRSRAVTVINGVSRRSMDDVEQAEAVARGRCRALVRIPWDDHLSMDRSPRNELKSLRSPTRRAYLALAGVVAGGFGVVPERYEQPEQEQEASR